MINAEKLYEVHPDLKYYSDDIAQKVVHTYRRYNDDGSIAEQWECINDEWIDVTEREKAKEELAKAEEALEREREKAVRKDIVEKRKLVPIASTVHCPQCGSYAVAYNESASSRTYKYICEECRKRFNDSSLPEAE